MNCTTCGDPLRDGAKFCTGCGTAVSTSTERTPDTTSESATGPTDAAKPTPKKTANRTSTSGTPSKAKTADNTTAAKKSSGATKAASATKSRKTVKVTKSTPRSDRTPTGKAAAAPSVTLNDGTAQPTEPIGVAVPRTPDRPPTVESATAITGQTCESCDSPLEAGLKFCTNCGAAVPEQAPVAAEPSVPSEPNAETLGPDLGVTPQSAMCVECGTTLNPTLKFCTNCGTAVPAPVGGAAVAELGACGQCGASMPPGTQFCTNCGSAIGAPEPEPRGEANLSRFGSWTRPSWVALACVAACVLLLITIIVVATNSSSPSTSAIGNSNTDSNSPAVNQPSEQPTANTADNAAPPASSDNSPPASIQPAASGTNSYDVTDGILIRSGPGTSYAQIGSVAAGTSVPVVCTTQGESIDGPYGPDAHWDRITYNGTTGYVTDEYVDTKGDVDNPAVIPPC